MEHRITKIADWIPHIKKLGANAIYFSPLFESDTHGYNTRYYKKIDVRLGYNEDFKNLCKDLHNNGIKVVVDGVFNHVGRGFPQFQEMCIRDRQYVGIMELEYEGVKIYFIDNEYYFGGEKPYSDARYDLEKFAFFSRAVLSALPVIDFRPDVIHCHDWHTGLIPVYLKDSFASGEFYQGIKTIMTIHNLSLIHI